MKANPQIFREDNDAVSPVIGVILMVAVTVVMSAIVYSMVSGGQADVEATHGAVVVKSQEEGILAITLIEGPDDGFDKYTLTANGETCAVADYALTNQASEKYWHPGEQIRLDFTKNTGCLATAGIGDDVNIVVTLQTTVVFDDSLRVYDDPSN